MLAFWDSIIIFHKIVCHVITAAVANSFSVPNGTHDNDGSSEQNCQSLLICIHTV